MIRRPPRSTLFPYTTALPICLAAPPLWRRRPVTLLALGAERGAGAGGDRRDRDRKSTRLNSSHSQISYAVFCLKKKKTTRMVVEILRIEARRLAEQWYDTPET